MTTRIGLAVSPTSVRALGVRNGAILWFAEVPFGSSQPLASVIADMLRGVPGIQRWRRTPVVAALAPGLAQVKRVTGLPTVADAALIERVIREGVERFFLRGAGPLLTGGVRIESPGTAWAATFEATAVDAIADACRDARVRFKATLPSAWVIGRATATDRVVWRSSDRAMDIAFRSDRTVESIRRIPPGGLVPADIPAPAVVESLAALGEDAWEFADAYGAAVHPISDPLSLSTNRSRSAERRPIPHWRFGVAATMAASTVAAAYLAPSIAAIHEARTAAAELEALSRRRVVAIAAERRLMDATSSLQEIAAFDRKRRSVTTTLALVARALPEQSALVAVRVDSLGGQVIALAPRAAEIVNALERVPGIAGPEILGPVVREVPAGGGLMVNVVPTTPSPAGAAASTLPQTGAAPAPRELERVTVRFRWLPVTSAASRTVLTAGGSVR